MPWFFEMTTSAMKERLHKLPHGDQRLHRPLYAHASPEHVVPVPLDAAQGLEVHGPHDLGRHQTPAIFVGPRQDGALVEIARARTLERQQPADRLGHDALSQILYATTV